MKKRFLAGLVLAQVCTLLSLNAHASSDDRFMVLSGDSEYFKMVDLTAGQCQMSVVDSETGAQPEVSLVLTTRHLGLFFKGAVYLSSVGVANPAAVSQIEVYKGESGRTAIFTTVRLTYQGQPGGIATTKNAKFVTVLDAAKQPLSFQESLGYSAVNETTYAQVLIPGKTTTDRRLRLANQPVSSTGNQVSFSRVTETGLKVGVTCSL